MDSPQVYTLYFNKWSICSQMILLTLAFKGEPKDDSASMTVEQKHIDIMNSEQLEEAFLTKVNPKGQVPVLTHLSKLPKPLPDSLDITHYIASHCPSLLPEDYKEQIVELLKELHDINYFSLSFGNKPTAAKAQEALVEKKLAETDISEEYRKTLEFKLKVVQNEKVGGVTEAEIEAQIGNAKAFLQKVAGLYEPNNGPWLWGRTSPTALDVHLAVFVARLHDVGRGVLVPEYLVLFRTHVMETKEWEDVYQGRSTMFGV
ncbi:hypothetical protein BKA61DRAFT_558853 [Leptodontidium sp. MPI-SDFR-AT-0119]|nr:hypothetical protein BKA61DRAFT_558853 [Leptodontidium sp. MPI-SDFR-AT-0119]